MAKNKKQKAKKAAKTGAKVAAAAYAYRLNVTGGAAKRKAQKNAVKSDLKRVGRVAVKAGHTKTGLKMSNTRPAIGAAMVAERGARKVQKLAGSGPAQAVKNVAGATKNMRGKSTAKKAARGLKSSAQVRTGRAALATKKAGAAYRVGKSGQSNLGGKNITAAANKAGGAARKAGSAAMKAKKAAKKPAQKANRAVGKRYMEKGYGAAKAAKKPGRGSVARASAAVRAGEARNTASSKGKELRASYRVGKGGSSNLGGKGATAAANKVGGAVGKAKRSAGRTKFGYSVARQGQSTDKLLYKGARRAAKVGKVVNHVGANKGKYAAGAAVAAAVGGGAAYAYKRRKANQASTYKRKLKSGKVVTVRKGKRR